MALLDFGDARSVGAAPLGWKALATYFDLTDIERPQRQPLQAEFDRHVRHVQQMLLAATLASGAILAVAAVMMLRFL